MTIPVVVGEMATAMMIMKLASMKMNSLCQGKENLTATVFLKPVNKDKATKKVLIVIMMTLSSQPSTGFLNPKTAMLRKGEWQFLTMSMKVSLWMNHYLMNMSKINRSYQLAIKLQVGPGRISEMFSKLLVMETRL